MTGRGWESIVKAINTNNVLLQPRESGGLWEKDQVQDRYEQYTSEPGRSCGFEGNKVLKKQSRWEFKKLGGFV